MTDSTGNVVYQADYDAYGQATILLNTVTPAFGYAGYYMHSRSNLNLTVHRAYSPTLARWLNRDPLGESGGINLYGYVGNDPVDGSDPLGLLACPKKPPPPPKPWPPKPPEPWPPKFPNCRSFNCCKKNWLKCIDLCTAYYVGARWHECKSCCASKLGACKGTTNSGNTFTGDNWTNSCFYDEPTIVQIF